MKAPRIQDIAELSALACGTLPKKLFDLSERSLDLCYARMVAFTLIFDYGYTNRLVSIATGVPEIQIAAYITDCQKSLRGSKKLQKRLALALKACNLISGAVSVSANSYYTADEELAIAKACVQAELFMQSYGKGVEVNPFISEYAEECDLQATEIEDKQ